MRKTAGEEILMLRKNNIFPGELQCEKVGDALCLA